MALKLTADPREFRNIANMVLSIADAKTPAASYMLIEAREDGEVDLYATNGDIGIKRTINVEVEEAGAICVYAKKMATILKNLDKEFSLKADTNDWIKIKSGTYNGKLPAVNSNHFPEFPMTENFSVELDVEELAEMIKSTAYAVTTEETRYTLRGVKLEFGGGIGKMIATDGARVAYAEKELDGEIDTLLPKKALDYLTKLDKGVLEVENTDNHLFFKTEDTLLVARKITGDFPQYETITNMVLDKEISTSLDEFRKVVTRVVSSVENDVINAVKFTVSKNNLKLENNSADTGYAEEDIAVEYDGDTVQFTLNSQFVKDFLGSTNKKELNIKFKDSNSIVNFNFGDDFSKLLLMPLRTR